MVQGEIYQAFGCDVLDVAAAEVIRLCQILRIIFRKAIDMGHPDFRTGVY